MRKNRTLFSARTRRASTGCLVYPLLFVLFISIVIALNLINNGRVRLEKESVTVASLPKELERFTILHISDLHGNEFGAEQATLSAMLKDVRFNAVCITGDVCASDGSYDAFIKLLRIIPDQIPVYFIAGDEDPAPLVSTATGTNQVKADYVLSAEAEGAIYLETPTALPVGSSVIWFAPESIYGLDLAAARETYQSRIASLTQDDSQYLPEPAAQLRVLEHRLSVLDRIEAAQKEMKAGDVQIALTHHPLSDSTITTLQQWSIGTEGDFLHGISLVLAGHYNAGQICLPGIGPLKAPSSAGGGWLPGNRGIVGLSTVQGVSQYITPGLGVSNTYSIPIRLFNTPAVSLITLTSVLK